MSYEKNWVNNEKLNEVEHIKLRKDGLDVIETIINKYGVEGYDSISADDLNILKWAGVYEQKPRDGHFMLRVRITSGIATAEQIRVLVSIARDFGKSMANITVRGAIQFHWIKVENLPTIFERLKAVNLCSFEACGDCPRTVIGNALAGIDKDEIIDTRDLARELNDFFLLNRDFSNLPRKFKISISGSTKNSGNAQINDLAFTPAVKKIDGIEVVGFNIWVGGGLSSQPKLAKKLDLFVKPEEVLKVAEAVCTIFRDYGYREQRNHARLKFLIEDWGVDKFTQELLNMLGDIESAGTDKTTSWNGAYFYGINQQKQDGKYYIGFNVPLGDITSEELEEVAEISEKFGDGNIRTTLTQNMILSGLNLEDANVVVERNIFKKFKINDKNAMNYTISCIGNEFCNMAVVNTKKVAKEVAEYIDEKSIVETPIRIHYTGCPNACGQKQTADLSFQGQVLKNGDEKIEGFSLWAGGTLEGDGSFAQPLDIKVKSDSVKYVVESIYNFYNANKQDGENFNVFCNRVGIESLKEPCAKWIIR